MKDAPITIEYLIDHPAHLPTIASWQHGEWGYLRPGDTLEARLVRLQDSCGRNAVPSTLIALSGNDVLGSASLVAHDMETRLDLTPWLAGVFVAPAHRRTGVGGALVRRIVDEAASLKIPTLYLYTTDRAPFYADLGWSFVEKTRYREQEVTIMSIVLGGSLQ